MRRYWFGDVIVDIHEGYSLTTFPDNLAVTALHEEQPGQAETAERIGYPSAEAMNAEHDAWHSWLAHKLGLPHSPTLKDVAQGNPPTDLHYIEEEAVICVARFAKAVGIDPFSLTSRVTKLKRKAGA